MSRSSNTSFELGVQIPDPITSALQALRPRVRMSRFRVFRAGVIQATGGLRRGDRTAQMIGATLLAIRIYQQWKRRQQPVHLYGAYLDMDESIGIRLLRKGNVIGEFPLGSPRE